MSLSRTIVTLGEAMACFRQDSPGAIRPAANWNLHIGGAEANVAIALGRCGIDTHWIGRIGADPFGDLILDEMRSHGVVLHAARDPEVATGLMVRARRTSAVIDVRYYRTESAGSRLCSADLAGAPIRTAAILHASGITAALSDSSAAALDDAFARARTNPQTLISFDVNYRSRLWSPSNASGPLRDLAARSDIVFATQAEAELLLAKECVEPAHAAEQLSALGPRQVLIKLGDRGAVGCIDGEIIEQPALTVGAEVDAVGAGDAFAAGYLAALLEGADPAARLRQAALFGGYAVATAGDCGGTPSWDELRTPHGQLADIVR
jgi:2-dehydro-3-deoxygluconokinase